MKVVQIIHGKASDSTAERMNGTKDIVLAAGCTYEVITLDGNVENKNNTNNKIFDRHKALLSFLCQNDDAFYIDSDMVLKSMPNFDTECGLPYFVKHRGGSGDEMMCFVNGNKEFFTSLFEEKERRGLQEIMWWFRKVLWDRIVKFIDPECYDSQFVVERDEAILAELGDERYKKS